MINKCFEIGKKTFIFFKSCDNIIYRVKGVIMKKIFYLIIGVLLILPIHVFAMECYSEIIDIDEVDNFSCTGVESKDLKFTANGEDYNSFFSVNYNEEKKEAKIVINKNIVFNTDIEIGVVKIASGTNESNVRIKNKHYVIPSSTTTTKPAVTYSVTLDYNDGEKKENVTCEVTDGNTSCQIRLPEIDKEGFNGWGTANTCKVGNHGTIQVDRNTNFYACYSNATEETTNKIQIKSLTLKNKDTEEEIDFGTFSIKKKEYNFQVLNNVENIEVVADVDTDIKVEVTGNENLTVGENTITIKLSDKSGNTDEYNLFVTRLEEGVDIGHFLKSLVIGGYDIKFDPKTLVYNLKIENNVSTLQITPIVQNESDKFEIKGNKDLKDGSLITINVTGDDGITTVYRINITKDNKKTLLIYIALAAVVLLILILVFIIIIKNNKKKKNDYTQPKKEKKTKKNNNSNNVVQEQNNEEIEVFKI